MEEFDAITVEIDFDAGSWTDVSSAVMSSPNIQVSRGIQGNAPLDRVAGIGTMQFALQNTDGTYSPGHASVQAGFGVGNLVRLSFEKDGETYYKFYGRIAANGIKPMPGTLGQRYTLITAKDWMHQVTQHELSLLALTTNQRLDQMLVLLDANLSISPLVTDYATGEETFPAIFNTLRPNTKAIAEINKGVQSEVSYYFVKGDKTGGETVVSESRYTRATSVDPKQLAITGAESDRLLKEDGDYLLLETGDKIILNQTEAADFDNTMQDIQVSQGRHLANIVKAKSYPIKTDAAATTVLFNLEEELEVAGLTTTDVFRVGYTDPSGAATKVSGTEMVTPVATTDYTAFAETAGGGADLTANMSITDLSFGAEGAEYTITNSGTASMFVNLLQFRGKGVYDYQPVENLVEDTTSQTDYGSIPLTVDMKYQPDPADAAGYGQIVLNEVYDPTSTDAKTVDSVTFLANRDSMRMQGFLQIEPGDRYTLTEDQTATDDDFFCMGYRFKVHDKKFVTYTLVQRRAGMQTFWILGTSPLGQDTGLGF
jgi:hypothetical protein